MSKTLLNVVNAGLRTIGEVGIDAFDADNELQNILIEEANNTVREVLEKNRYRWGLDRSSLVTVAAIDTGQVAVVNGSTTVTSKDDDGDDATNFGSVAAGMFFRKTTDLTSYLVASVDTSGTPHTLTLEKAYLGTSGTGAYRVLKDTYALTDTAVDEIKIAAYGEAHGVLAGLSTLSLPGSAQLDQVDLSTIYTYAGGDLHRDSTGKPRMFTEIARNSSDQRQLLFWPYPDAALLIELRHTRRYDAAAAIGTVLFGGDAPDVAYDCVEYRVCRRACVFDNDNAQAGYWDNLYRGDGVRTFGALGDLLARENRTHMSDNAMRVQTFQRGIYRGTRVESQRIFDRT